jgi:L-asparaginase
MADKDRVPLLGMVRAILNETAPMLITHDTDTMVQSGRYLERALPDLQVPNVMTGAMTPLGFEGSDGLQNLTASLLAVRLLTPGIYVAMHGSFRRKSFTARTEFDLPEPGPHFLSKLSRFHSQLR